MKKLLAVVLIIGMLFSISACGNGKNNEQTDGKAQTESNAATEAEANTEAETKKITKEEYENMTADDLFNAVIKDPENITLDEYIAVIETLQYVDITDSLDLKRNITNDVLKKLRDEYWCETLYPRTWVPLLITHEAPQVRGMAFGNAHPIYNESPEFVAAAKEVMKTETEPYVLYYMMRQIPSALVANDPEINEFVQRNTTHENELVKHMANKVLENAAEVNQ